MRRANRICFLVFMAFCAVFAVFWLDSHYTVPVIMYHKVEVNPDNHSDTVSPETFRRQMHYLESRGYQVIPLDELILKTQRGDYLSKKAVVLTFDDGYENNYTEALPVLQQYQYPATVFVSPDFIGKEGFLSLAQMKEMQTVGLRFGSHGMSQAYLPDLTDDVRVHEIAESRRILQQVLEAPVDHFCYPVGGFNHRIKEFVQDSGYKGAMATNRGYDRFNKDVYEMNRIRFSDNDDSEFILWAKLSGYYNLFRKLKNPD